MFEDFVMDELDKFMEENEMRNRKFRLLIDPFSSIQLDYEGKRIQLQQPVYKKKKRISIVSKKDLNSDKNLF
jgi:hypothetical protein